MSESSEMQGAEGSQAAICRFIGKGGKINRDSFYKRLAATPVSALPSSISAVDITVQSDSGKHRLSLYILNGRFCSAVLLRLCILSARHLRCLISGCVLIKDDDAGSMQNTWLVGNALGGRQALKMAIELQKAGRGGLVPWAGVAAQLPSATYLQAQPAGSKQGEDEECNADTCRNGQAFCFLPLPCQTGDFLASSLSLSLAHDLRANSGLSLAAETSVMQAPPACIRPLSLIAIIAPLNYPGKCPSCRAACAHQRLL